MAHITSACMPLSRASPSPRSRSVGRGGTLQARWLGREWVYNPLIGKENEDNLPPSPSGSPFAIDVGSKMGTWPKPG